MKLYGSEGILLMEVESIAARDQKIQIKGKMMGQVPMTVVLGPADLRETVRMVPMSVIWQAIRMYFSRG